MRQIALFVSLLAILLTSCTTLHEKRPSTKVSIAYVWSLAEERSTKIKEDIYVEGYVVLNDKLNEVSRSIVIADDSGGLELKIDAVNIDPIIPLYSYVTLRLSGLSIGREGGKVVVGAHPTSEYVVDRIDPQNILNHLSISLDVDVAPAAKVMEISNISLGDMLSYIRIEGVSFIEADEGCCWAIRDEQTGEYQTTLRHLTDGVDILRVVIHKDCRYAAEPLPEGILRCTGIVDWHDGDIALRISNHRISEL